MDTNVTTVGFYVRVKGWIQEARVHTEGYEGEKGCFGPNVINDSGFEFLPSPLPTEEGIIGYHQKVARK